MVQQIHLPVTETNYIEKISKEIASKAIFCNGPVVIFTPASKSAKMFAASLDKASGVPSTLLCEEMTAVEKQAVEAELEAKLKSAGKTIVLVTTDRSLPNCGRRFIYGFSIDDSHGAFTQGMRESVINEECGKHYIFSGVTFCEMCWEVNHDRLEPICSRCEEFLSDCID